MIGDPHEIRALATRLRADAELLRRLATRVGRTRDLAWRSRAATLFRARVGERVHALGCSAQQLDEAATRVQAHAEGVEAARAEVLRVAALGVDFARTAGGAVARGGGRP